MGVGWIAGLTVFGLMAFGAVIVLLGLSEIISGPGGSALFQLLSAIITALWSALVTIVGWFGANYLEIILTLIAFILLVIAGRRRR